MRIMTNLYTISPEQFFKLSVVDFFMRQGWGYLLAAVILIVVSMMSGASALEVLALTVFALVLLIGYPVYRLRQYASGAQSTPLQLPRRAEIDQNGIRFVAENGAIDAVPWQHITRVEEGSNYFLIYMGRQFHVIPYHAFQHAEDAAEVAALLEQQGLL